VRFIYLPIVLAYKTKLPITRSVGLPGVIIASIITIIIISVMIITTLDKELFI